ncbi:MAG: 5'/3'-nucleotidase SurE [Candidatus Schekmanbacteria bacterium GWA2_38_11]|uniref:5'-nucleotidase SurE n=1 Tax=Candidatus Schekmanbacteria bacterium GWA2_38_11 TaxID=1817876 RepID=A0A1F7RCF3_9BACT|nr:MAG: 5'/3'-nucleotidase SurE [Candidatus Schekmanbacteria bacterium GWA2_38_11]
MNILISNDDGIYAPGIKSLAEALSKFHDVVVVAPDRDQSATSHSLTLYRPLRVKKVKPNFYSMDGTPTDCINLAVNGILKKKPDLVISGINQGPNLGDDITYSGTVSAAIEGTLLGISSFAVSIAAREQFNFDSASEFAVHLAEMVLENGLPPDTFLNVNVPNLPKEEIKGIAITQQGKRIYEDLVFKKLDPRGEEYYWIGGGEAKWEKENGTDFEAIENNKISITPLHLDLTNYKALKIIKNWNLSF